MLKLCQLMAAILVGSSDIILKGDQEPFNLHLVPIGQAVSEEKIFKHFFPLGTVIKLNGKSSGEDMCRLRNFSSQVPANRKWTCHSAETVLHYTILYTDDLCQISGSWHVWYRRKMCDRNFSVSRLHKKYSKFWEIGSRQAIHSKLFYNIQFSILMLCVKYQEAGMPGS